MNIKFKSRTLLSVLICLFLMLGSFDLGAKAAAFKVSANASNKNSSITEKYAISKIKHLDVSVRRLTPCNKSNTVESIVNKYSKDFFMFLANYGSGQEEYTSEELYLVNKKTGIVYTLRVNGTPVQRSRSH
jgi:hypothetical protein